MNVESPALSQVGFDIADPHEIDRLIDKVSPEEWAARVELAAVYRLIAMYGMTDLVFTHISMRLPDEDGKPRFLINPYGVLFDEITASSLVKIDTDGNVIGDSPYFVNAAGFTIHSAVHMHRHDAKCVIHVHTPYGIAVSCQKQGLRKFTQMSMQVHDDVSYHDYEGIALDLDERDRLVADLGETNLMILRNHGTMTLGANGPIAFLRMYFLEMACKAQILAQSAAPEDQLIEHPDDMSSRVQQQGSPAFMQGMGDNLIWPAMLRRLKRHNPGYDY